jgi:hypothetical protein
VPDELSAGFAGVPDGLPNKSLVFPEFANRLLVGFAAAGWAVDCWPPPNRFAVIGSGVDCWPPKRLVVGVAGFCSWPPNENGLAAGFCVWLAK